ncbi:MAG: hypothetical protein HYV27_17195 [Candidatus Hydrogenedentes bacterium]|nr:hypothetical protein [Candidatus Hydrogenedentota bacterium]
MTLTALVLLIGGIVLIIAEFLLPHGIAGGVGILMVIGSTGMAIYQFPDLAMFIVAGEVLGVICAIAIGFYGMTKGKWGNLLVNTAEQRAEEGYVNQQSPLFLLGSTGTVMTALRPAGTIVVEGERYDAVSEGAFIDQGASVRVLEVHGNRIVVEQADSSR